MSDEVLTKEKRMKVGPVSPFTIEADDSSNSDLYIQVLGGLRMRSTIKQVKEIFDKEDGEQVTRSTSANMIDGLPRDIPGQRLRVNPAECTWECSDPLRNDQETLDKIQRAINAQTSRRTNSRLRGIPTSSGKLGVDEMKTLIRELLCFVDSGSARVVKGIKPEPEDVNEMPGRYLLNWSNQGQFNQPRYEDELEAWKRQLNRMA